MLLDKFQYLPGDAGVAANVTTLNFPVAQLFHLCILGWHDANGDLRRLAQIRTVVRSATSFSSSLTLLVNVACASWADRIFSCSSMTAALRRVASLMSLSP